MIDLRSDTVTKPDTAMRTAASEAVVGDDVYGEDPTVNELESRMAELFDMEAALFVPSGTMGNQIAASVHTNPGEEVICEESSHIFRWELAGLAQHAGLQTRPLEGDDRGRVRPEQLRAAIREADDHSPGTGLVCLENTHNARGGTALSLETIASGASVAHEYDIPVHLDGARLFNAAEATDTAVSAYADVVDSVMSCLSKGLGAPVGSVLAGEEAFIEEARRIRKLMGGGMRQAGIVAGPALEALSNRQDLSTDHEHAKRLAAGVAPLPGVSVQNPETNIVLAETEQGADEFLEECAEEGVLGVAFDSHTVRFCTHRDIATEEIDEAIAMIESVCRRMR